MNELERVTENLRSNEYCTYAQMNEAANMLEAMRDRIAELEKDAARRKEVLQSVLEKKGKRWHLCDPIVTEILDACEDTAMKKD